MGKRARRGRPINGILLLDKPSGISSNGALQRVKRYYQAQKAGHCGSLDPLASGLLPVCLGEATKISAFMLDADKQYQVSCLLGVETDSYDADGQETSRQDASAVTLTEVGGALQTFLGEIEQIPPMYSALHHNGQRLYELARKGVEVEREARLVTIREISDVSKSDHEVTFTVTCSKGTYVRSLVFDLGRMLGVGAHVTSLRRTGVAPFFGLPMVSLDALCATEDLQQLDAYLLPMEAAIADWPAVTLSEELVFQIRRGQAVPVPSVPKSAKFRLHDHAGEFVGIGKLTDDGMVAPKRLIQ